MAPPRGLEVTELRGELIKLRPLRVQETEAAWQGLSAQDEGTHPRSTPEDRRPEPPERFRRRVERSGRFWRGCLDLAIDRRGRLIGEIQARRSPKQTLPPGVVEIGIVLYRPRDRGRGYGREAVRLLTEWLFDVALADRVQATTTADNLPMRIVLENLGFRCEGILRGFGRTGDGTRLDGALFATLRTDPRRG